MLLQDGLHPRELEDRRRDAPSSKREGTVAAHAWATSGSGYSIGL
jgi:hypothetical protein